MPLEMLADFRRVQAEVLKRSVVAQKTDTRAISGRACALSVVQSPRMKGGGLFEVAVAVCLIVPSQLYVKAGCVNRRFGRQRS